MRTAPILRGSASFSAAAECGDLAGLLNALRPVTPRVSSILLPVERGRPSDVLVADAVWIANRFGARLIGLGHSVAAGLPANAFEHEAEHVSARAAAASFKLSTQLVNASCEWVEERGSLTAALGAWAWAADLVMLLTTACDRASAWRDEVRDVLDRTGLPVLVWSLDSGCARLDHVVVIWDETAASQNAARAALPFLGKASTVTLLAPPWRQRLAVREQSLDTLRRGLLSRNIRVHVARLDHHCRRAASAAQVHGLDPDLVVAAMPRSWVHSAVSAVDLHDIRANLLLSG